jgi:hypothetical protein
VTAAGEISGTLIGGGGGAAARGSSGGCGRGPGVSGILPTSTGLGCDDGGGSCAWAATGGATAGRDDGCAETAAGCFGTIGSRTGAIGLTGEAAGRVSSAEIFIAATAGAGCAAG